MRNVKLVNIIGIDGAGKTTLAKSLAEKLQGGDENVTYRYCQYFAKLLYPMKYLAKITVMRRTDEFEDYSSYNSTKKNTSRKFPLLANIYAFIWLVDYSIQILLKVSFPIVTGKKLIIDRYIYDIALNLSLTTGSEVSYAKKLIDIFLMVAPTPDLVVYIDLPEEIAFNRKDDIQDIEYLRERRLRYLELSNIYSFVVIDGTRSKESLLQEVSDIVMSRDNNNDK